MNPLPQPTGTMTYKVNTHTLMEPPTSNPQGVPPNILQLSHTNGTPYPQPTGSTTHQLTTCIHSRDPHTHPLPPTHREYHPPTYKMHTLKGPPTPTPYPQPTGSTTHQLTTLIH